MQDGPIHPWRVRNNAASLQKNANTTRLWCSSDVADGPAAFVPLSRGTDRLRHPRQWRRCKICPIRFALRRTRMLSLPVQQGTAAEHARTHKPTRAGWLTRNDACGRGAPQLDGLCRNWFGILPLQCQKVTLRPVPDSASTPSRCAQRGGAPRHRRASEGMAQRLPFKWRTESSSKETGERERQFASPHELCCGCGRWRASGALFKKYIFLYSVSESLKFCVICGEHNLLLKNNALFFMFCIVFRFEGGVSHCYSLIHFLTNHKRGLVRGAGRPGLSITPTSQCTAGMQAEILSF